MITWVFGWLAVLSVSFMIGYNDYFGFLIGSLYCLGRCGSLMVSALDSGASGPGSSPDRGHCVVFLGKTLYTLTVPPSTQVYKWVKASCWGNLTNCREVTCDGLASRPGEVEILLVASCYRNRDKLRQV